MGTDRYLTLSDWRERAKELKLVKPEPQSAKRVELSEFQHSGIYVVWAIASHRSALLEAFLGNITSQNIDRSELIIIDANSPRE